jgi:hypothetical protein
MKRVWRKKQHNNCATTVKKKKKTKSLGFYSNDTHETKRKLIGAWEKKQRKRPGLIKKL